MFVDMAGDAGPPPRPRGPRLSPRGERVLIGLVLLNAVVLLLAPIGGATIVAGIVALFR